MKWTLLLPAAALALLTSLPSCSKEETPLAAITPAKDKRVFISGSAAVSPLLRTLAQEFAKKERDIQVIFLPDSHSDAAVAGTNEQEYDLGAMSRERLPEEKENPLRYLHLARDGMVFITHSNLSISDLSSGQIRDIYLGKTTNWAEVGGPNEKIVVIDRPEYTSAKLAFRKTFLKDPAPVTPDAVVVERPWQVSESVQWIGYSIGYTSLGEIVAQNPAVNIISVNGIQPTQPNIKDGAYKFIRPFGMVLGPRPKASTMRFVNFIFSETGSRVIENSGYIPQRYEILIGIVPEQNVMVQNQRYQPLADYLSHKLGERFSVKLKLFSTYIEACRSLADGSINAAFLGSTAYATVRDYVDVLARPNYHGVSTYRGVLLVRAESDIRSVEQMRGKRLVMGGRTTTAGFVFPLYYFKKQGVPDYEKFFSNTSFVGTHEDAVLAVLHHEADVAAAKDLILQMFIKENPGLEAAVRVIAKSPPVPSNAFVVRKNLNLPCFDCHSALNKEHPDSDLPAKFDVGATIQQYLLDTSNDPEGRGVLSALGGASGFIATTDADYDSLYEMMNEVGINPSDFLTEKTAVNKQGWESS